MEISEKSKKTKIFSQSISKIQQFQRKSLTLSDDALYYLDKLLNQFLCSLITPVVPKSLQEAQEQVKRKVPEPLYTGLLEDANYRGKSRKKLLMSVDKVHQFIKDQSSVIHVDKQVYNFYAALLEYLTTDILKLTVSYIDNFSVTRTTLSEQDVKIAMFADKVLVSIFQDDETEDDLSFFPMHSEVNISDQTYESVVKSLLAEEQRYLRDLQIIIKLFKNTFKDWPDLFNKDEIYFIFCNIEDIAEMSIKLIAMLDEAYEMVDDDSNCGPLVGNCFEDLAEECNFYLYAEYTKVITRSEWNDEFLEIVTKEEANNKLKSHCDGYRDVVLYVLPKLLLAPVFHCFFYFEQIEILRRMATDPEDKNCFNQVASQITPIRLTVEGRISSLHMKKNSKETSLRNSWGVREDVEKIREIQKNIEGWTGKDLSKICGECAYEGNLIKVTKKHQSERKVFLFDTLLLSCKNNQTQWPMPSQKYRLKEKVYLRKAQVIDNELDKLQFSILDNETNTAIVFQTSSEDDKKAWMSHLVRLQYGCVYDRMLEQIIQQEIRQQPLRIPTTEKYRFAEPDNPGVNIVHDPETGVLKGASVPKLVELLTSHKHYDAQFTKTFLTMFRTFCLPHRLLDLLFERFRIPEPPPTQQQQEAIERGEIVARRDLKRFRQEYAKPIQLKVLNVIRKWLEYHWYDFEPPFLPKTLTNGKSGQEMEFGKEKSSKIEKKTFFLTDQPLDSQISLLTRIKDFVDELKTSNMSKWIGTIQRIVERKSKRKQSGLDEVDLPPAEFKEDPPPVLWHTTKNPERFDLMTLHPMELARQITIRDFDLYRRVQCTEFLDKIWTKKDKEFLAPNLYQIMSFSSTLTYWIMKSIILTQNYEERVAMSCRTVEILLGLEQLNSFNGYAAIACVFSMSAILRLQLTLKGMPERYLKKLEAIKAKYNRANLYVEELQNCDPPCVPFYGSFLSHLFKLQDATANYLDPETKNLINFTKRVQYTSLLSDVQQYQLHPYNLQRVDEIQQFLNNLDPYDGRTHREFNDWIYGIAFELEPKGIEKPPRFPRIYTDKEIKSPGIAVSKRTTKTMSRDESRNSMATESPTTSSSRHASAGTAEDGEEKNKSSSISSQPTEDPPNLPPREPIVSGPDTPPPVPPRAPSRSAFFSDYSNSDGMSPTSATFHPQQSAGFQYFSFFSFDLPAPIHQPNPLLTSEFSRILAPQTPLLPPSDDELTPPPLPPRDDLPLSSTPPKIPPRDPPYDLRSHMYSNHGFHNQFSDSNRHQVYSQQVDPNVPPPVPGRHSEND